MSRRPGVRQIKLLPRNRRRLTKPYLVLYKGSDPGSKDMPDANFRVKKNSFACAV
jgi:hypothetical protein